MVDSVVKENDKDKNNSKKNDMELVNENDINEISNSIKVMRVTAGWTQEELAKKVSDYKKVFALDVAKYKKLFTMAPSAVEDFKAVLDGMIGDRDKKYADLAKMEAAEGEVTEQPKEPTTEPTTEPKEEPKAETPASKFGVRWGEGRMVVFAGKPEVGETIKVTKVEGTNNLKVGETAKITKPVEKGKPIYIEMTSGDNKGRTFNSTPLTALKTA